MTDRQTTDRQTTDRQTDNRQTDDKAMYRPEWLSTSQLIRWKKE